MRAAHTKKLLTLTVVDASQRPRLPRFLPTKGHQLETYYTTLGRSGHFCEGLACDIRAPTCDIRHNIRYVGAFFHLQMIIPYGMSHAHLDEYLNRWCAFSWKLDLSHVISRIPRKAQAMTTQVGCKSNLDKVDNNHDYQSYLHD